MSPRPDGMGVLEDARINAGLSRNDLWLRYFALGGMASSLEVEAVLLGALLASPADHDVLAVALNERFTELGGDHPVPYSGDAAAPPRTT